MIFLEKRFNFSEPRELNMYYCGKRVNTPNHSYGPAVRTHYLIVFIKSGRATLNIDGRSIPLFKNHLLVMFPGEKIHYTVNEGSLWTISWIGVYGKLADKYISSLGITPQYPVYKVKNFIETEEILERIFKASLSEDLSGKIHCISLVHEFFSVISKDIPIKYTVKDYINFMRYHFEDDITVKEIAENFNTDRSYFSKLIKKETGKSPNEIITDFRMEKAKKLLGETELTVNEIAFSVGIKDPFYFSRLFKKKAGLSPRAYRSYEKQNMKFL